MHLLAELLLLPHKHQLLLHRFERCGWSISQLVSGQGAEKSVAAQSVGVSGLERALVSIPVVPFLHR